MPKKYTDEQIARANNVSIEDMLRMQGAKLKRDGNDYRWLPEYWITIRGNSWYDHKQETGGGAVSFVKRFHNMDFKEAMEYLLNGEKDAEFVQSSPRQDEPKELILPDRNGNMHRVFAYLIKTRGIDADIVEHFAHTRSLYEDDRHNAVFVGMDEKSDPKHAHKKGTSTFGDGYRKNASGSDSRYSFTHKGTSDTVYAFESPIDMMSYITLNKDDWRQNSYISLNGVSDKPLLYFLSQNSDVRTVCLCLDNDTAGQDATERISANLTEQGYAVYTFTPELKDWNEDLRGLTTQNCHQEICRSM